MTPAAVSPEMTRIAALEGEVRALRRLVEHLALHTPAHVTVGSDGKLVPSDMLGQPIAYTDKWTQIPGKGDGS